MKWKSPRTRRTLNRGTGAEWHPDGGAESGEIYLISYRRWTLICIDRVCVCVRAGSILFLFLFVRLFFFYFCFFWRPYIYDDLLCCGRQLRQPSVWFCFLFSGFVASSSCSFFFAPAAATFDWLAISRPLWWWWLETIIIISCTQLAGRSISSLLFFDRGVFASVLSPPQTRNENRWTQNKKEKNNLKNYNKLTLVAQKKKTR